MVADIYIGNNLYDALSYNQEKINAGFGNILEANRIFVPADGQFSEGDCMRDFERAMLPQVTTTHGIIHISLNPHPEDRIGDDQLADIGRRLVYSALDADGNHAGKPLKSSLLGKPYSIETLEQMIKQSGEEIKTNKKGAKTKALVSASLNASRNGGEFRVNLREKGIDLMLRYGNGGTPVRSTEWLRAG